MKKVMKFVKGKREEEPVRVVNQVEPPKRSYSFEKTDESSEDDFINNDKSVTKVHKAVWSENVEKVKSIIKINDIDITDKLDRTALYFAILKNNPTIIELLLENNANQNIPDIDGVTPFLKSIQLGYVDCVITLINHGADFKRVDKDLNTCLHYAINAGHMDILRILLDQGMDCNIHNINGEYPIHAAVKNNNIEMVEVLLIHGAGVNAVDCRGVTALMLASSSGYLHIVNLLEKYNADNDLKDEQGKTAVDYASSNGYKEIVVKLRNSSIRSNSCNKPECSSKSNDSDSWNDSPVSARSEKQSEKYLSKISEHFLQEETDASEKSESDVSIKRSENASPQSGVIPPPCKPLRSLEYLQAGMSSDNRPVHLLTLGTVRTRHVSMTESEHSKSNTPHRYSYQGDLPQGGSGDNFHSKPPDLLSCIGDEKGDNGNVSGKNKHHCKLDGDSTVPSDWGSDESLTSDEYLCSGKKEIKIVPLKDGAEGRDNTFLQKQFSILENYEKNHSRNCSVSHEINKNSGRSKESSQRDLDDIANFLEDNNRINCQLEKYAGHSDILVMAKKSRSLPRNCQPGGLYQTGSMSLPRTLDSGKDFIRDMKRYGSYRPKSNNIFSSKSKNDSITSSKKHGFIDKLKNMFGKKSQVHLTTEIQDANKTWLKDSNTQNYEYDTISRKSCSSKHSSGANERNSYSERIRCNTSSVHSYILKDHDNNHNSDSKGCERKISTMGSTSVDLTHSRKSSGSRSFSEKISVETYKLDNEFKKPPFDFKKSTVCEECRSYIELTQKEAEQTVLEKESFIALLRSQMEELKNRIANSSTVILETKYNYIVAQQEIHVLKHLAQKYECEVRKLMLEKMHKKECICHTATLTDEPPDKWNKQTESDNEICVKKSKLQLEINTLKTENEKLEEHIEELQKQLHSSTERLLELENALSTVRKEMNDITCETQKEKFAIEEEFKLAVKQMNDDKFSLEDELNQVRRGYEKLQSIYSETRTAFDESVNQHGNIIHENDTLKEENKTLLHKLCELEKQAASIKGSALIRNKVMWDRLRKNNINFVSSNRSSLEMINVHYEESRSDTQNSKNDLKCICFSDSDQKMCTEKRIGPSLQEIMLEIELLNTEYCEMHIKLQEEELQKTLALLENEKDRLKDQIVIQNDKIMSMEITIEELTRDNCEGCTKIEEVLDEHDQLKKAFEEMLTEIEKCRKDIKIKTKTIKEQEANIARYIHDIQRWEQNVHDLEDKLSGTEKESDKKSIKISALETTQGECRSNIYKLEDQLSLVNLENETLTKEIITLEKEKKEITENLSNAQTKIAELDSNFSKCEESIHKLKENNDSVLVSFEELQMSSLHKEADFEKKIAMFKRKIDELSAENIKLKTTVEEQQIRSDNLILKMESLTSLHQNEISAKAARNNELAKDYERLKKQMYELDTIKKHYDESQMKCTYNENLCQDLIRELDSTKQELEIIKKELSLAKCKQDVSETLDKENNEMKYAVEVLRSILDEDYEKTVKSSVDISKIKLDLYTKLSSHIPPIPLSKSDNNTVSSKNYKQKSKIPQSMVKLKRLNFDQTENNSENNLRTSSLPNLDENLQKSDGKQNFQFIYHGSVEENKTETLARRSSSLDNLKKADEEDEDEQTKCNERWEQQMEGIRKLKQEIKECTQKLNDEKNNGNRKITEDNTKRDEYKELVKNLQKQITELQAKSTQETCKNFSLEAELAKLKGNMAVMSEMENEIKKLRVCLERERQSRIREIELSKVKKEEELRRCQEKFKKEFIEMEAKFKADLIMAQDALKAKNIEEMKLKQKCEKLSKEVNSNIDTKLKKNKNSSQCSTKKDALPVSSMFSYPITDPLPVACICAISGSSQQSQILKDVMRTELDTSIKRHRLQSENVPVVDNNSEEDLNNKHILK